MKEKSIADETLEEWVERLTSKTDEELAEFDESKEHVLEVAEFCKQVRDTITFKELHMLFAYTS